MKATRCYTWSSAERGRLVEHASIRIWNDGKALTLELKEGSKRQSPFPKPRTTPLTTVAISTDQCTARRESVQGVRKLL